MKIYSSTVRGECEVFAIAVSFNTFFPPEKRTVLYIKDKETRGLIAEELSGAKIIDDKIGANFKIQIFRDGDGIMFFWDYFNDIAHLARLIDFDPETVDAFEKALASFPNSVG